MRYVLYHANCMDGIGSRYAAWKKFGDEETTYIPVQYSETFPITNITDKDEIYILDFSYNRNILVDLANRCSVTVIDHHETAEQLIGDLPFVVFDINKSAAVLSWEYFHPGTVVPYFLQILQDYDLWNWELEETLHVSNMFSTDVHRDNMSYLDKLVDSCEYVKLAGIPSLKEVAPPSVEIKNPGTSTNQKTLEPYTFLFYRHGGKLSGQAMEKSMKDLIEKKKYRIIDFEGYKAAVFNTTEFVSMLGHAACNIPGVDFSISYFFKSNGDMVISFRSKKGGVNVGEIAKRLGGGGHQGASGVVINLSSVNEFLNKFYN